MDCKIKIGLLPLYIKLYDDIWPGLRIRLDAFLSGISNEINKRGIEIVKVPVCRMKDEFNSAIKTFEESNADAIVTLHLAYSPSLESAEALASTKLPIVVLDTTEAYDFSPLQNEDEILYNHGIHGVQDMCSLLTAGRRDFFIEAGHWLMSDVLDRVAARLRGIKIASEIKKSRTGIIGKPFEGMGDFHVPQEDLLKDIGIDTIRFDPEKSVEYYEKITECEIKDEIESDLTVYNISNGSNSAAAADPSGESVSPSTASHDLSAAHREATIAGLIVRKWISAEKLTAFTINFMDIGKESGLECMPFLEISKAMARGTGYAGEGDILTAALTGALMSVYKDVSFIEMFCPDWKNNAILLSHMGEMNLKLVAGKPLLLKKAFPFSDAPDTVAAYGRFREGQAVVVNLAPGRTDCEKGLRADCKRPYSLLIAGGEMTGAPAGDNMKNSLRGWFRPVMPVERFLEEFSLSGGTHHSALIYCSREKAGAGACTAGEGAADAADLPSGISGTAGGMQSINYIKKALTAFAGLMGWRLSDIC
ncbi:MAG: hypothetical protein PHG48_03300 [Eubacteriales bacterium]|nr:hypothetical protein [Eubacteriales bacterium]